MWSSRCESSRGADMRKARKEKARSCSMCKPHKMKWANRWKPKEEAMLRQSEIEMRNGEKSDNNR